MNRNHQSLELDKVLELLAAETTCADAAVLARELTPVPYLSQVQRLMEETDARLSSDGPVRFTVLRPGQKRDQRSAPRRGGRQPVAARISGHRGNPAGHPFPGGMESPLRRGGNLPRRSVFRPRAQ